MRRAISAATLSALFALFAGRRRTRRPISASCLAGLRGPATVGASPGRPSTPGSRPRARHEGARASQQPARVQDADLGLPRRAGRRRARGGGPGDAAMVGRRWRGRAALRRRPPHRRGGLGRRIELRQGHRRAPAGAVAGDALVLRGRQALFPRASSSRRCGSCRAATSTGPR